MAKKTSAEPSFSDNFWSNSSDSIVYSTQSSNSLNKKSKDFKGQSFLHSVDESPEFHDPYSDLSLFLSSAVKQEMKNRDPSLKWSLQLQEELLEKINPQFQERFPQYRLGVHAIKKIWKKISFYTQQMQDKKEAIDSEGKININFFIKENLRQYFQQKAASFLSPYQCAYQIASKMSDCIATLEGTKPKLDLLTQTVWALQKHLLGRSSNQPSKTPYDEFDKIDKLIVKTLLEITAKQPQISLSELEHKAREALQALHGLPDFSSADRVTCNISAILADKLYASSPFHFQFFAEQKTAMYSFIEKHISLYKSSIAMPALTDLVRRIMALYTLASQMPKDVVKADLFQAICHLEGHSELRPKLCQSVFAFISAEALLLKTELLSCNLEQMQEAIWESYQKAKLLPPFEQMNKEHIEIIIWKRLSETEGFLEKLPYRIGQKIEEEIAGILIDAPEKSFSSVVHETTQFFKQVKLLTETKKWNNAGKKIHLWCIQNDMLCRSIKLKTDTCLGKIIVKKFKETQGKAPCHTTFISQVCQEYLQKVPSATIYLAQLSSKAWTLYKYMWFNTFSTPDESSLDRFYKWHIPFLEGKDLSEAELVKQLEELCRKCLPLIPFDAKQALAALQTFPH